MSTLNNEDIRCSLYEDAIEELRCDQPELIGNALVMEVYRLVDERFFEEKRLLKVYSKENQ